MIKRLNFKHSDEQLKKDLKPLFAYDLALYYPLCDDLEKKRLISLIHIDKLTDMFVELDSEDQIDLINRLEEPRKKSLLRNLESDDLKEFIEDIDPSLQPDMMALLSKVKAKTISLLLQYDEDVAASIMSTDFLTISIDDTIKEATDHVIKNSKETDYIDTLFVIDDDKRIVGLIDLKDLIMARSNSSLKKIMIDDFQFVYDQESIEKAIQTVVDYDRNVIPVLDSDEHVIGIVTADDIFDEIIDATEDDYQKMALLSDYESSSTAFERTKQRLPWLMIAVVLNLLTASLLSVFENTLQTVTIIVFFQPLILGMAGNIGTQALAVTILGINKNEFDGKHIPKNHVLKEMLVGLINSALLGFAAFLFVTLFLVLFPSQTNILPYQMGLVVFGAMMASMFVSSFLGVIIPMILHRHDQDPSSASGPLMTTLNDIVSLVIYFSIATLVFL
ncbi:MAG TPA: magnesium transporter [Acholeplasmataceae bacterium]|nr:magnesium transporter [Acholeplasmataceae bacterium]HRX44914.1 magnesium transporter [Acholeplasmataceae bacterium]